jgi:hypothetical protein
MIRHLSQVALVVVTTILLGPPMPGQEHKIYALFDLPFDSPRDGPFPSDWFRVRDDTQNTGHRVSLPKPDCQVNVSDCQDLDVINELDGFNLQPRLSIPFSGAIDPISITSGRSSWSAWGARCRMTMDRGTLGSASTRSSGIQTRTRFTSSRTSCSINTHAMPSS